MLFSHRIPITKSVGQLSIVHSTVTFTNCGYMHDCCSICIGSTTLARRFAIYPPWESLAEAEPRPNFPMEDKVHNLRANVVDPASTTVMQLI